MGGKPKVNLYSTSVLVLNELEPSCSIETNDMWYHPKHPHQCEETQSFLPLSLPEVPGFLLASLKGERTEHTKVFIGVITMTKKRTVFFL